MEDQSDACIEILQRIGVNFVGIDFDQTFITKHTGGRWAGGAEELATASRPEFVQLVPKLINNGIHIAIVTFSGQTHLIEQVLKISLGADVASRIVIRARDKTWGLPSDKNSFRDGKQKFLASAAEQLERMHSGLTITRSSTLLIDDDQNNIHVALERGVRALWFIPEEPENLMSQIISLPV